MALLKWLGVTRWHVAADGAEALADLILIDLPDHDSTQTSHRAYVDHFVERVDLMVWVLDPQKYADALVHEQYLRRFSRHDDVTVVVLNQVDKLPVADAQQCLAHLRRLVAEDGLSDVVVLGTSNRSGEGLEILADRILLGGRPSDGRGLGWPPTSRLPRTAWCGQPMTRGPRWPAPPPGIWPD